jgi:hypothetical protein
MEILVRVWDSRKRTVILTEKSGNGIRYKIEMSYIYEIILDRKLKCQVSVILFALPELHLWNYFCASFLKRNPTIK